MTEGECIKNPSYMEIYCAKSCKTCNKQSISFRNEYCSNEHNPETDCYKWANSNECIKNPSYMYQHCSKACGYCTYDDRCNPTKKYLSVIIS